jgi:hypothetical protein
MRVSAFAVPPGPVALAVYVTEFEGVTLRLPEGSTEPIPPSIVTPVALLLLHESSAAWPLSIVEGEAVREIVGAGGGGGGGGGSVLVATGGGVTFFLQPVPVMAKPNTSRLKMASVYRDFLMNGASFESVRALSLLASYGSSLLFPESRGQIFRAESLL